MPDPEDKKVFVEVTLCGKCGQLKIPDFHLCPPKRKACPQCGTSYNIDGVQSLVCHGCGIDIMTGKIARVPSLALGKPLPKLAPKPKPKPKKKPKKKPKRKL